MAANVRVSAGQGFQATHNALITAAETNQLVTGSGRLLGVVSAVVGTNFRVQIYDATAGTSNLIFDETFTALGIRVMDMPFQDGLRVITSNTAGQINIQYNPF